MRSQSHSPPSESPEGCHSSASWVSLDEGHGVLQAAGIRVRAADGGRGRVDADRRHARRHANHLGGEVGGEKRRDGGEIGLDAAAAAVEYMHMRGVRVRVAAATAAAAAAAAEVGGATPAAAQPLCEVGGTRGARAAAPGEG